MVPKRFAMWTTARKEENRQFECRALAKSGVYRIKKLLMLCGD